LDAAVLRAPFFHHVHSSKNLDAAGHGRNHRRRYLVDLVQYAIDAEAHVGHIAPRLDVNIARTFFERILQKPIHQPDDMLVVGVEFAAGAKLDQLLEIGDVGQRRAVQLTGALDRTREIVELHQEAIDVLRIGDDAFDLEPQDAPEFGFPLAYVRFAGGDDRFSGGDADRKNLVSLRIRVGHDLRNRGEVDLERIDMKIREPYLGGKPFRKGLQRQQLLRVARILPLLIREEGQGVTRAAAKILS